MESGNGEKPAIIRIARIMVLCIWVGGILLSFVIQKPTKIGKEVHQLL